MSMLPAHYFENGNLTLKTEREGSRSGCGGDTRGRKNRDKKGDGGYRGIVNTVEEMIGERVVWGCGGVFVGAIVGGNGSDSCKL